jgi:thioredoxin reductase (NADPH)
MENNTIYDLIIVGAGPAGLTAAIYARRANLSVLMLEASAPGGKLLKTAHIENWPGLKTSGGPDLAFSMFDHAMSLQTELKSGVVNRIELDGDNKKITLSNGDIFHGKTVFIATGTVERKLNIPGEEAFLGKGVSYCAVCDGALFKDKVMTVIGGGNSALEEALYLTKFATKVNVLVRRDVFRADAKVVDEVKNNPKIHLITKVIPIAIQGGSSVEAILIENTETKEQTELETSAVFPFVGLDPMTSFLSELNITTDAGYVTVNQFMETSVPGLYAGGDVIDKTLRQVVTATNDGAIAAQAAIKYLDGLTELVPQY